MGRIKELLETKTMTTKTIAEKYAERLQELVDDMQDDCMDCFEHEVLGHCIRFGDGSVVVEPEQVQNWCTPEEWEGCGKDATPCYVTDEDQQATAVLKAAIGLGGAAQ